MTCFPDEVNWNNKEFTKEMLDYLRAVYCVHPMVLDALDYINSLESRIAELEAERRWIPVSERLPEVNEDVFTVVYDTNDGSTSVSALKHHGDGVWFIWDKGYYVVTHWMPLPKPPEVQ